MISSTHLSLLFFCGVRIDVESEDCGRSREHAQLVQTSNRAQTSCTHGARVADTVPT
jgi:hypothetical protein